jgi:uncharacterized protein
MAGSNLETVKAIYAASAEGRIGDIVSKVSPQIIWVQPGTGVVPWAGTWLGPDRVGAFFARLNETAEIDKLDPREYVEAGDTVVALGYIEGRAKAGGKPFACNFAMVWKFKDGLVEFHQAYFDTSEIAKAFAKEA